MKRFTWAPHAYRRLRGLLCVYKPAGIPMMKVVERIQFNLARDLNELPCYKLESVMRKADPDADLRVPMMMDPSSPALIGKDMLEHRLILGQRYIPSDVNIFYIHGLSRHSSGVTLLSLGRSHSNINKIAQSRYIRVYHVKGRFGWATDNYSPKGKIIERTSYRHITPAKLDKVTAAIRSSFEDSLYHYAGLDPSIQATSKVAEGGLLRPEDGNTPPIIYNVNCIDFQLPDFTLEIYSINENCDYFKNVIHDIGLQLRSTAVCTGIRRLRYGHFDVSRTILRQQWNLEDIIANLHLNRNMLKPDLLAGENNVKAVTESDDRKKIEG